MSHRPNILINTKNCYRTIDKSMRKKKPLLKNGVIKGRRNRESKKRREADRERNLWEEKRSERVIVRVWEERKNKGKRKNERVYCEKGWMSERKYCFLSQKKIIFIGIMCCMRERLFSKFLFWKTIYRK